MDKKILNVLVPSEIYTNFLPSGTIIDRPGLPLLKIIDAKDNSNGNTTVSVEVSPSYKIRKKKEN